MRPGAVPARVTRSGQRYGARLRQLRRAMVVFPTDMGRDQDFEERGMVAAVSGLIDQGR